MKVKEVTILILIDGFLQYMNEPIKNSEYGSQSYLIDGFLQSKYWRLLRRNFNGHNPYFNRWFSAISSFQDYHNAEEESQSLF